MRHFKSIRHLVFIVFCSIFLHIRYYQPIRFAPVFVYKDEIRDIVLATCLRKKKSPTSVP